MIVAKLKISKKGDPIMTKFLISLIVAVIVIAVCLIVVSLYVYDMAIKRRDPGSNQAIAPATAGIG